MKFYTGIGSRQTPPDVLRLMEAVARRLRTRGWTLRSGHAPGADRAFEVGAGGEAVIYLPWPKFGVQPYRDDPGMDVQGLCVCQPDWWAANYADVLVPLKIHNSPVRAHHLLHGRNVAQVIGHDRPADDCPIPSPDAFSRFVLCWCPESAGTPVGGTATAVKLARHLNIPVFNLFHPDHRARVEKSLES